MPDISDVAVPSVDSLWLDVAVCSELEGATDVLEAEDPVLSAASDETPPPPPRQPARQLEAMAATTKSRSRFLTFTKKHPFN